jgi:hypothetical protein
VNPDAKPDANPGYTGLRYCRLCQAQVKMHIRMEKYRILVTCHGGCNSSYELPRY